MKFLYSAKSFKGEEKKGVMEAKDSHDLSKKLRDEGFILISAKTESKKQGFKIALPFGSVPLTEKMFFVRNLQVMTSAGLPLPRAIGNLSNQAKNERFKKSLLHIQEEITKGRSLSSAMGDYPDIFPELFQSMVAVGEESGTLDKTLKTLSSQMEKEHSLKSKITGAMVYPTVIILAMLGVGVLMLVTVVPRLAETFEDLAMELPASTRVVMSLAKFMETNAPIALLGLVVFFLFFYQLIKQENVKRILDGFYLKLPVISSMTKSMNSAYLLRTLSSLLSAGTSLPRALEITAGVLGNYHFKQSMKVAAEKVRKGKKFSEILSSYPKIYPLILIQMVAVGEETGETSDILSKLSDFFEEEVANFTKNLTSIIEPVIMLIIGGAIGFFAVSMIQPMYTMLGAI